MIVVRPFQYGESDYQVMAEVYSALAPDAPLSAVEWRIRDELHNPQLPLYRFVGELDGKAAGYAEYYQSTWCADPRHLTIQLCVHPAYHRRGLGNALWNQLQHAWQPLQPHHIWLNVREDWHTGLTFAGHRQFYESRRVWSSRLDLASFNPEPFHGAIERVTVQGIDIISFARLAETGEHFWQQLYEFERQTTRDLPTSFPITIPTYEQWRKFYQPEHGILWEGSFAALHDGDIVGISTLETVDNDSDAEVGFTAVRRDYRGRGIALALKLATIAYGKATGISGIRTDNDSTNLPMWHINQRLGFQRGPMWIVMHRHEQNEEVT